MIEEALTLSIWLVELFPKIVFTIYHVAYLLAEDKLIWEFPDPIDDQNDIITLLIYGINKNFFLSVVAPRLDEFPEGHWCFAGDERVIVTFEPLEARHYKYIYGYSSHFQDYWMSSEYVLVINRGGHKLAPPQE